MISASTHTTRIMDSASRLERRRREYASGCVTARYLRAYAINMPPQKFTDQHV